MNDKQAQARLDEYTALKAKNFKKSDKSAGEWVNGADIMLANIERIDTEDEPKLGKEGK